MLVKASADAVLTDADTRSAHPQPQAEVSLTRILLEMTQELSHARTLESVVELVRNHARDFAGSDGVCFVLRDGDRCHYVEENAIAPLWKGRKFPISTCVSGWVITHKTPAVIEDIFADDRVPIDAYAPTFVRSLVMVPIRRDNPIGAIGFYWAGHTKVSAEELSVLQALADNVSVAIENVSLYAELQSKIKQLQESNHELGRFAWVASHDLQEPLRTISMQVELLSKRYADALDERARGYIATAKSSARRLQHLVEDLLVHARVESSEHFKPTVISEIIDEVLRDMHMLVAETGANITYGKMPWVWGERVMIGRLFQNLISNAIKFHKPGEPPLIHIACAREGGSWHFTVSDAGIGIEPDQFVRIFGLFQRVHTQSDYPGSGIGLATCKKIVELHQGRIWVESELGQGSTFHVLLPLMGEDMPGDVSDE